jgi:dienelactone hydrolase
VRSLITIVLATTVVSASPQFHTHTDRLTARDYTSLNEWQARAAWLRDHVRASAGLLPPLPKTPLRAHVFDEQRHSDYSVAKVYFESFPGFFVTGNLYRPIGAGPFPAMLSPHGHWAWGRLENTSVVSGPGRAINFARQGFVVFTYDMIGYNDSRQLTHEFGGRRERLWGLSLSGLQLWNSIRSVDFLESLPEVDRDRIGCTGESGGGTQTFLLAAVDERIKVAAPVNMISLHMQGGCLCENPPGLRLDTNNVELGALAAPRPLLMVSATGDWTNETLEVEYPAMRRIYALFGAEDRVHAVRFDAPHNYNRDSREAVYSWMARWLQQAPADVHVAEQPFTPDRLPDLLVFHGRTPPKGAITAAELTEAWISASRRLLQAAAPEVPQSALLHALGFTRRVLSSARGARNIVVLATDHPALESMLARAGFTVRRVAATPFDAEAAAKIEHFATYNRTDASQRVADLVRALDDNPGAMLVADGAFGLPAVLALAVVPIDRAVIDVGRFDATSDDEFLARLDIPGIRRAGDVHTALAMATGHVTLHNAGDRFVVDSQAVESRQLTPAEIVALLKSR